MHAHGKHVFFVLLGCSLTVSLQAQDAGTLPNLTPAPDAYQIERITALDGLPSSGIVAVEQDADGFFWLGGSQGLFRYDGYTFTTFLHDPADSTSLAATWVEALHVDPQGTLWVGTFGGGLNRYDPDTESFTAFRHDPEDPTSISMDTVTVMLTDSRGTFWVGTHNGLNRFDSETETFTQFQHDPDDPNSLSNNQVRVVYEDRHGTLWVGTGSPTLTETPHGEGGLNRFHPETGTFTRYLKDPDDPTSLLRNKITALYEDSEGTFWVGTEAKGLHTMDRERGTFTRLRMDPRNPDQLDLPYRNAATVDPMICLSWSCGIVSFIHEDRAGNLWIGDLGAGLTRYDRATGTMEPYEPEPNNPNSLSSEQVWHMHESRDGSLWVGSWQGLSKITPRRGRFRTLAEPSAALFDGPGDYIQAVYTSPSEPGIYWMGTSYGILMRYDATRQTVSRFDLDPDTPRVHPLEAIVEDHEGALWIGGGEDGTGRLYRFDRARGTYETYAYGSADETRQGHVHTLLVDRSGTLWVGAQGTPEQEGLYRFNPENGTFSHYSSLAVSQMSSAIHALYEDAEGMLWVGSQRDLLQFDRQQGVFTLHTPLSIIRTFTEDQSGRLWMGSGNNGLWLLDRASNTLTRVEGLPESNVLWIEPDDRGYLWVAMEHTLARYNPESGGVRTYSIEDGLPTGVLSRARTWTDRGELLFTYESSAADVVVFDPNAFEINDTPPQVRITGVETFDESLAVNNPSITLSHDENDLTVTYVALHYGDPARNQYRYRLEDYDRSWVDAGTQRSVRYPRLPPGNYTFRVTAANSDGVWNEEGASINVTIRPPWWQTWWAYLLYGLLLVGGVFAVDRFQRRRLIAREREKARERELEQAREIEKAHTDLQQAHTELGQTHEHLKATQAQLVQQEKLASLGQLTAGIAHEIKNPLNFVNNFADLNEELATDLADELTRLQDHLPPEVADDFKETLSYIQVNASKIREQGQRADAIVQSMMQHASGGAGQREACDVNALVEEYVNLAYHGKRAQVPDFNVEVVRELDAAVGSVPMVPQEMGRVLLNLCSNAFDAVYEKARSADGAYEPSVSISTRRNGEAVEISVRDNGPGIPEDIRKTIFEPFFTTKPTGSGTGLGLSMSYEIVAQGHGGRLTVESEEGKGATFVVTLPG